MDCMNSSTRDSIFMSAKVTGSSLTVFAIMFLISQFVLRLAIMESSKTSVFLGISRDKLSVWQIFLDVRNLILKL